MTASSRSFRTARPATPCNACSRRCTTRMSGNRYSDACRATRPKGPRTRVVITEFDLPRKEALPHDVVVDLDGHAWYSDFGAQMVGELDPKTGKVSDIALPVYKPEQPKGSLDLELDPEG